MTIFDAVLLSYDEPMADALHSRLQRTLGGSVKRLHGVHGMRRAYRLCAEVVAREQFLLADGDFAIAADFDAAAVEPLDEGVSMRVWQAINPVNGLAYGYGGLKLIRRSALREMGEAVDVLAALPGRIEFAQQIAGITRFNQSPFHSWRPASESARCSLAAASTAWPTMDPVGEWSPGPTAETASSPHTPPPGLAKGSPLRGSSPAPPDSSTT